MTTTQPSLFEESSPVRWVDQLQSILDRTLTLVRTAANDGQALSDDDLEHALELVRRVAEELRIVNSPDDVPF